MNFPLSFIQSELLFAQKYLRYFPVSGFKKDTPMLQLKVYISGPMTGLPGNNYSAFHKVADQLLKQGFHVFNPASNKADDWQGFMRESLKQIAEVDVIYMLPGWSNSKGAKIEHQLAKDLGLLISYATVPAPTMADVFAAKQVQSLEKEKKFQEAQKRHDEAMRPKFEEPTIAQMAAASHSAVGAAFGHLSPPAPKPEQAGQATFNAFSRKMVGANWNQLNKEPLSKTKVDCLKQAFKVLRTDFLSLPS